MICSKTARFVCAAALIAMAVGASAAPTRKVQVVLLGDCAKAATEIILILKGDETWPITLTPLDATHKTWAGDWPFPDRETTFNASDASASLRLGGARTDCRQSSAVPDPQRPLAKMALFTFECDAQPAHDVTIHAFPEAVVVAYNRHLRPNLAKRPWSLACDEHGAISGLGPITDVRFPGETLILKIGLGESPVPDAPGLRVSKLTDEGLHLDRAGVVQLQAEQRAAGNGSAPNTSPNAYDVDIALLDKSNLGTLEVAAAK